MKFFAKGLLSIFAFIASAQSISATEWNGITPLHSSRTDIVRMFNACGDNTRRCYFSLADQNVQIVFSGWQGAFSGCPQSVPKDTVLLVRVWFNRPMQLKAIKINLRSFKAFDLSTSSDIDYRGYIDERSGLLIKTYKHQLVELDYIASRDDQKFCPRFYENSRGFVSVLRRRDRPTIMLSCPSDAIRASSRVTFLVYTPENFDSVLWTVTDGTIVSGQGTREIIVDTTGLGGRKITVTVEMTFEDDPRSYSSSCVVQASEQVPIEQTLGADSP